MTGRTLDSDAVLIVDGLGKKFAERSSLLEIVKGLFKKPDRRPFIALDNVTFSLGRGEALGILGRNGAGKSTLLKILSGVIRPSCGHFFINGNVGAILELGSAFQIEATGRANVITECLCMGMSPKDAKVKMDSIIKFAELENFVDKPMRIYSTGMRARLAFSVAASVQPDVLIVDEALSVGDAQFAQKCFGYFRDFKSRGGTVILVSHDMNTISSFCDKAMILDAGRLVAFGKASHVVTAYHKLLFGGGSKESDSLGIFSEGETNRNILPLSQTDRYGNRKLTVDEVALTDDAGMPVAEVAVGQKCKFTMKFRANEAVDDWSGGMLITNRRSTVLFGITNKSANLPPDPLHKGDVRKVVVEFTNRFTAGYYGITFGVADPTSGEKWDFSVNEIGFHVHGDGDLITDSQVHLEQQFRVFAENNMKTVN